MTTKEMNSDYMTVTECAKTLGVQQTTIIRWINDGRFSAYKFGKKYFVDKKSFNEFFESCRVLVKE